MDGGKKLSYKNKDLMTKVADQGEGISSELSMIF